MEMKIMKTRIWLPLLMLMTLLLAACAGATTESPAPTAVPPQPTAEPMPEPAAEPTAEPVEEAAADIVDIAVADGRFTTLVTAVTAAGLVDTLKSEGPFTVFAPTDDAFAALPAGTIEALLNDLPLLTDILLYHVVSGAVLAADVVTLDAATTVLGEDVTITVSDGNVFINDAQVIIADIEASNGVIHVIDAVLLPPAEEAALPNIVEIAVADGRFETLVAAVVAADLADVLQSEGPFTVFAPTDEAFAALPEGTVEALLADIPTLTDILLYHVVAGAAVFAEDVVELSYAETAQGAPVIISVTDEGVFINDAQVIITDIEASNGVIHVIDAVILPPTADIVETAVAAGSFTTLAAALEAAGLIEALQGEGPFTVFAPTDDAFAALPDGLIDALLADIPTLTDILLYHVVEGWVFAADVVQLDSATTLLGEDVTITVENGNVFINDAQVIITNILTTNGVIHVIDAVIVP
jgi:transforming growth factor-beta-induced protein